MKQTTGLLFILAALLILASSSTVTESPASSVDDMLIQPERIVQKSYETHAPIQIDNNTHFSDLATAESWDGDGSIDTPYIISGYNITQAGVHGINLNDVTVYYEIRDCFIDGINKAGSYYGIFLDNCDNGLIENCTVVRKQYGIQVEWSPSIIVNNCTVLDSGGQAIGTFYSDNCQITDCFVNETGARGVYVSASHNTVVDDVYVEGTLFEGVYFQGSDYTTLSNAEVFNCGGNEDQSAIRVQYSDDVTIVNVTSHDNPTTLVCGISAQESDWLSITSSYFYENNYHGINLVDSNWATLVDVNSSFNDFFGFRFYNSNYTSISESDIHNNAYDGAYVDQSRVCEILDNDFWENGPGDCEISMHNSPFSKINGNTLVNNTLSDGIYMTNCDYTEIVDNVISGNNGPGINIWDSHNLNISYNTITENNGHGIILDLSNDTVIELNDITNNDGFGVYLASCYDVQVIDNTIAENWNDGMWTHECKGTLILFNRIYENGWDDWAGNPQSGLVLVASHYSYVIGNWIYNNTIHGIDIDNSENCTISSNSIYDNHGWSGAGCGIYMSEAHGASLSNNTIYDNHDNGLYAANTDNCDVLDNRIFNNAENGLDIIFSLGWTINDNTIWNHTAGDGIYTMHCDDFSYHGNDLYDNLRGSYGYISNNCNFTNNNVFDNSVTAVILNTCLGWLVTDNIITGSSLGIYLVFTNSTSIYYNDFGWLQFIGKEQYSDGTNLWDDNVSRGNWYVDYDPLSGPVPITNDSLDIVNYDRYPMTSMWIRGELEVTYEFTTIGHEMTFGAYARNPSHYEVYFNSILDSTHSWDGNNITVDIDGLPVGENGIMIYAYHISGGYLIATGVIDVEDTTAPSWVTNPTDQVINFGDSLSYLVQATDPSGLGTWAVNDTQFAIVDGLITNAVTLDVGNYGLRISVQDIYNNELSFEIRIRVLPAPTPTTTTTTTSTSTTPTTSTTPSTATTTTTPPPFDPGTLLIIVVGVGGVVVVIVIIVIVSKKRDG